MESSITTRRILVTGASIAGNTAGWWLSRAGHEVTVVERAPSFRDGGQNVDVRGAARTVVQCMGLEEKVAAMGTGESGLRFVNTRGEKIAEFRLDQLSGQGFTAELEILRGDLARLLYEEARSRVTYRFGDAISSVTSDESEALVRFESGVEEQYDIVIVAEGVGSKTRELIFPGENQPRWLDVTMGYFTIPKGPGDSDLADWYTAGSGRSVFLRPDNKGTTRAVLTLVSSDRKQRELDTAGQKDFLRDRFRGAGWETERVLQGLDQASDFYFDVLRQVKIGRWRSHCVFLCGDAAWCATPLSGIGTSLALVGAYVLAGELATAPRLATAASNYERIMRPFVEKGQNFPKAGARMAQPKTQLGVLLQSSLLRIAAAPGIRQLVAKIMTPKAEDVSLPTYSVGDHASLEVGTQ